MRVGCFRLKRYLAKKLFSLKTILLFGAGKSATVLIEYLIAEAEKNKWKFIIADANKEQILLKTNSSKYAHAEEADIRDEDARASLIKQAHVVISMLPPDLHFLVAKDCVEYRKHLLTASYLDRQLKSLQDEINNRKLFFLCEMGLDPGIDHMSAMLLFDRIKSSGGTVTSFESHCGGLVAPESDDNPWHYKISWNPRNVVMAGKAGAMYKKNDEIITENYHELFAGDRTIHIPGETIGNLSYYPNRDSLAYIDLYGLQYSKTFLRTTLRYPAFMHGWQQVVALGLTDETPWFDSEEQTLRSFFKAHIQKFRLESWFSDVGNDQTQLFFLGLDDDLTIINKGLCSSADVLQFALETKLVLKPEDRDMVVMVHEIKYTIGNMTKKITSSMLVKGRDHLHTAMAKTVGLPLGIAAKLILTDVIKLKGLHIPIHRAIYEPVLEELKKFDISFMEHSEIL